MVVCWPTGAVTMGAAAKAESVEKRTVAASEAGTPSTQDMEAVFEEIDVNMTLVGGAAISLPAKHATSIVPSAKVFINIYAYRV